MYIPVRSCFLCRSYANCVLSCLVLNIVKNCCILSKVVETLIIFRKCLALEHMLAFSILLDQEDPQMPTKGLPREPMDVELRHFSVI